MRKILITGFITLLSALPVVAQVYIQTTLPTVGLVQKTQLWNLVLINGSPAPMEGKISLALRNRSNGSELLAATTSRFTLNKGSMPVNVNNLNPIQYNYIGMMADASFNGLLPVGAYTACYSFSRINGEKMELLTEECVAFDVEPLSPPMLLFPADSAELEVQPAQFTWTPPAPAAMMGRLQYDIQIAEILPGQKPAEAIQQNTGFYNRSGVAANLLTYPASLPAFETGKWYCWQVTARDEKNYAGKTETWVFRVHQPMPLVNIENGFPYLYMKSGSLDEGIAPNGLLRIAFYNRGAKRAAKLVVSSLTNPGQQTVFVLEPRPGENQVELNLKRKMNINETDLYKAELELANGEKFSVQFRVKNFNGKEGINQQ